MRKILSWTLVPALIAIAIGLVSPSAGIAAPSATSVGFTKWTNQDVWAHMCAASYCGYHAIPPNTAVRSVCSTSGDGQTWDLIVGPSPWDSRVPIAGYVVSYALNGGFQSQSCATVGNGPAFLNHDVWAHSCPSINCGYGVMGRGHDTTGICYANFEDHTWDLVLDHNHPNELAGFMYAADYPKPVPSSVCW